MLSAAAEVGQRIIALLAALTAALRGTRTSTGAGTGTGPGGGAAGGDGVEPAAFGHSRCSEQGVPGDAWQVAAAATTCLARQLARLAEAPMPAPGVTAAAAVAGLRRGGSLTPRGSAGTPGGGGSGGTTPRATATAAGAASVALSGQRTGGGAAASGGGASIVPELPAALLAALMAAATAAARRVDALQPSWFRSPAAAALAAALDAVPEALMPLVALPYGAGAGSPVDSVVSRGTTSSGGGGGGDGGSGSGGAVAAAAAATLTAALQCLAEPLLDVVTHLLPVTRRCGSSGGSSSGGGCGNGGALSEVHVAGAVTALLALLSRLRRRHGLDVTAHVDSLSPLLAACLRWVMPVAFVAIASTKRKEQARVKAWLTFTVFVSSARWPQPVVPVSAAPDFPTGPPSSQPQQQQWQRGQSKRRRHSRRRHALRRRHPCWCRPACWR